MTPFAHRFFLTCLAGLVAATFAAGCAALPGSKPDASAGTASKPAAASAAAGASAVVSAAPGMNERGDVIDSKKVEMGHGIKVKGIDDWEGEVLGKPAPGTKFSKVKIGMEMPAVEALIGAPSDKGTRLSGSMFNPFYFGADKYKRELVYKGMGRLVFGERGGFGRNNGGNLIWIIHNANEPAER